MCPGPLFFHPFSFSPLQFVYAYCFYYYLARSDMTGLMQATFYFGYNLMACLGFFFMLGYVGWCVEEGRQGMGAGDAVSCLTCRACTLPHRMPP